MRTRIRVFRAANVKHFINNITQSIINQLHNLKILELKKGLKTDESKYKETISGLEKITIDTLPTIDQWKAKIEELNAKMVIMKQQMHKEKYSFVRSLR